MSRKLYILFTFLLLFQMKSFAQYLYEDGIFLKTGIIYKGTIIEDHKPEYLKIKTQEHGIIQIDYKEIKKIFRKVDFSDPFYKNFGHRYLSISAGVGQSYGGFGVRFQQRFGRKVGFAYSVGLGMDKIPDYEYYNDTFDGKYLLGISLAAKFYPYKWVYIEFGIVNEFVEITSLNANPFAMLGYDFLINKNLLINAGIGYYHSDYYILDTGKLAIDFGVVYKFR